uniref:Uncharacterized protein n=1 Tax=Lygus hesperus TaxID=30085 RepID=A0A0K8ST03_LYGHE
MDSPQLYDTPELKKNPAILAGGVVQQKRYTELSDLSAPEISLDLQNLIDDSQFSDGIFQDILTAPKPRYNRNTLAYMPQPVHFEGVKEEPLPGDEFSRYNYQSPLLKTQLEKVENRSIRTRTSTKGDEKGTTSPFASREKRRK